MNAVVPVVILWVVKLSIDRVAPPAGHPEPMSGTTWVLVGSEYANNEARGAGVKSGGDRCRNLRSLARDFLSGRLFGDACTTRRGRCRSLHSATRKIGPAFRFDGYLTLFAIV